jgi:sucrose-6-phosphate hydrolase SacC (GH32 family)
MAASTSHLEDTPIEPPVRTITRQVPNLRNPAVAEEYKRQRAIITAAAERQREEMQFWESVQSHEGWV